jgi:hypothetical protein
MLTLAVLALNALPRDMVVVEIATGTWCTYCPGAAMGADDLVNAKKRAAIVEYHNGDSYANTYSDARNSWYAVTGFPTAFFDGGNPSVGGNHTTSLFPQYQSKVNTRMAVPAHFTIAATGTHTGTTYNVTVTITKVEPDTNTNLKLHGVLTESGFQVNWQGQNHLEFVERLMAPDQNGTTIDFSSGDTQTVNLTFNALPAWDASEFEFIFFLQNATSKEILQGCKYSTEALENVNPMSVQNIAFGDVNVDDIVTSTFAINNWWTQDMNIDISVDNPDFFVIPETREAFTIPFLEAASYTLFYTPTSPGEVSANVNITTDNPAYPNITIPVTANAIGTANQDHNSPLPDTALLTAYPNPFLQAAALKYYLAMPSSVEISIYNLKGEKLQSLSQANAAAGYHTQSWNGLDEQGKAVPTGLYLTRLSVNGKLMATTKLIKVK